MKTLALGLSLAALLASPASAGTISLKGRGVEAKTMDSPKAGRTVWYAQTNQDSVADIYVNNVAPTCRQGAVSISQWFSNKYSNDGQNIPLAWNLGDFTGFYPGNNLQTQRGLTNAQYGGTGIQVQGGYSGWQIETTTAAPYNPSPNFIAGIISAHNFCDPFGNFLNIRPFQNPNTIFTLAVDLQVPYSNPSGGTVNTAAQMVYMIDPTVPPAGLGFWYSFSDYSSVNQSEMVIYDEGTQSAVVGAFPGAAGRYSTDIGGARLRLAPWTGYKTFRAAMTAVNLKNAVDGLKAAAAQHPDTLSKYLQLSDDPSVYIVGGGILDTEVARAGGHDGGMGLSSHNVEISTITGGSGCGSSNTAISWSCGSGKPNDQWIDVGGGCYQYDSGQACNDRIIGQIDSVQSVNGTARISGWTCAVGSSQALGVNVYSGNGSAQAIVGGGAAWNWSESAIGKACLDYGNAPHRFQIDLDPGTAAAHRGEQVYVYGIFGSQSGMIGNAGQFRLP